MITDETLPYGVLVPDSKTWMSDPDFYATSEVYSTWHTLRTEQSGYAESFTSLGSRYHSFFKYQECARLLRDDRLFTSRYGTIIESIDYPDTARDMTMTVSDGATHDLHRAPANRCLTKRSIEQKSDLIKREIRSIVAAIDEGDDVDLCAHTKSLPMGIFGPLLPVERDQWREVSELVFMSILPEDPSFSGELSPDAARRISHAGIFATLVDAVDVQQKNPEQGVFCEYLESDFLAEQRDPLESILANSYSLLMGAHATTNQVANHLANRLANRTDICELLRSPAGDITSVVNEAVRWVSPTNHLLRRAVCDTEIGGQVISEGDWVVGWVGSANRDETCIISPHKFDPHRRGKHLGFGIGSHYCIGSHIASFGLAYFFEQLIRRFEITPGISTDQHTRSNWINGYSQMSIGLKERR
ncbi:cytochrome P450 [Rhodococcus qingshengii]|uniref:cytochrome P450 n=1 Tax=Rhodococcus qingshengii TaxID=334542 RepID=UPI0035FDD735